MLKDLRNSFGFGDSFPSSVPQNGCSVGKNQGYLYDLLNGDVALVNLETAKGVGSDLADSCAFVDGRTLVVPRMECAVEGG